jgi:hypothetical protein
LVGGDCISPLPPTQLKISGRLPSKYGVILNTIKIFHNINQKLIMCNKLFTFLRNLWIPASIKKEIDGLHHATIRSIWDQIYTNIYAIGEHTFAAAEEKTIKFQLDRIYEIDGYWKKYNYETLDFGVYKLHLNSITHIPYKSMIIAIDFYSDGIMGYLEMSRKT